MSKTPDWQWPPGRILVLYHWSWFDPVVGDVIAGWSQRGEVDGHGMVHFEEERTLARRSVVVFQEGYPAIEPHTFSTMTRLPSELREWDGQPFAWIRALLGES